MSHNIEKNLKKYSLTIVIDAYVTRNAILDLLTEDNINRLRNKLINEYQWTVEKIDKRIKERVEYFQHELDDIEEFLNQPDNIHWIILGYDRRLFDEILPKRKRRLEWFHRVDRFPFDHSTIIPSINERN